MEYEVNKEKKMVKLRKNYFNVDSFIIMSILCGYGDVRKLADSHRVSRYRCIILFIIKNCNTMMKKTSVSIKEQ